MEGQSFDFVRCLFCITGKEQLVAQKVEELGLGRAIFPRKVKPMWEKTGWGEQLMPLLPSYVFVYSSQSEQRASLRKINGVIRLLCYEDEPEGCLSGNDLDFARYLYEVDGVVGRLKAVQVGSFVQIVDGALEHLHGRVVKVDKRKRLAKVDLDAIGGQRSVWLGFQFLNETEIRT